MDLIDYTRAIIHILFILFTCVVLLFNQNVFGVTMILLAFPFSAINNNRLFELVALYLSAIFNNIAMMDHTTNCMNAIFTIIFYLSILVIGTFFFYFLQNEEDDDVNPLTFYLKMLLVIIMDLVNYNLSFGNEWYLLVVFVSFLKIEDGQKLNGIKIMFYLIGFFVNGFSLSIGQWISYSLFVVFLSAIDYFNEHS